MCQTVQHLPVVPSEHVWRSLMVAFSVSVTQGSLGPPTVQVSEQVVVVARVVVRPDSLTL